MSEYNAKPFYWNTYQLQNILWWFMNYWRPIFGKYCFKIIEPWGKRKMREHVNQSRVLTSSKKCETRKNTRLGWFARRILLSFLEWNLALPLILYELRSYWRKILYKSKTWDDFKLIPKKDTELYFMLLKTGDQSEMSSGEKTSLILQCPFVMIKNAN